MDLKLFSQNTAVKIFSNLSYSAEKHIFDDVHEILLSSYERLYLQARKDQINKVTIRELEDGHLLIEDG